MKSYPPSTLLHQKFFPTEQISPRAVASQHGVATANKRKNRAAMRDAGFTLVELLVVVAVMSLLLSMMLPVLKETLRTVHKTSCANRLKQFGVATTLFVDDNRYLMYQGRHNLAAKGQFRIANWPSTKSWGIWLQDYLGAIDPAISDWQNELRFNTPELVSCPLFMEPGEGQYFFTTGSALNRKLRLNEITPKLRRAFKSKGITPVGTAALFADRSDNGHDHNLLSNHDDGGRAEDANVVHVDGSVQRYVYMGVDLNRSSTIRSKSSAYGVGYLYPISTIMPDCGGDQKQEVNGSGYRLWNISISNGEWWD